ncbi:hypothetical protein BJ742DRAFT_811464 [Cladochytrium replicatum]|nr:hypothetical protein BJ742DRAFT_811464 [Cladochytrium replicatum]
MDEISQEFDMIELLFLLTRFRPAIVRAITHQVLKNRLRVKLTQRKRCLHGLKKIADEISNRLKELDLVRYKYFFHVPIGEMRGEMLLGL